jgi:hypothetical protein
MNSNFGMDSHMDVVEIDLLIEEVNLYLDTAYQNLAISHAIHDIRQNELPSDETILRSKERFLLFRELVNHLISFLRELPALNPDGNNHEIFHQFRDNVAGYCNLLRHEDVKQAIVREYCQFGRLMQHPAQSIEDRIKYVYSDIRHTLELATEPVISNYFTLFGVLEKVSQLWFETRGYNFQRIRKIDVYLFKLITFLHTKYYNIDLTPLSTNKF